METQVIKKLITPAPRISKGKALTVQTDSGKKYFTKQNNIHIPGTKTNLNVFFSEYICYQLGEIIILNQPETQILRLKKSSSLNDISYHKGFYLGTEIIPDEVAFNSLDSKTKAEVLRKGKETILKRATLNHLIGNQDANGNNSIINKKTNDLSFVDYSHTSLSSGDFYRFDDRFYNVGIFNALSQSEETINGQAYEDIKQDFNEIVPGTIDYIFKNLENSNNCPYSKEALEFLKSQLEKTDDFVEEAVLRLNLI